MRPVSFDLAAGAGGASALVLFALCADAELQSRFI